MMHVCVIDDQKQEVQDLIEFLEAKGERCVFSDWSDGPARDEALSTVETQQEVVVVLDLYWDHKIRGPEIISELRSRRPAIPIVVFTTDTEETTYDSARAEWRVDACVTKSGADYGKLWRELRALAGRTRSHIDRLVEATEHIKSREWSRVVRGAAMVDGVIEAPEKGSLLQALRVKRMALEWLAGAEGHNGLLRTLQDVCTRLGESDPKPDRKNLALAIEASGQLGDRPAMRSLAIRCLEELKEGPELQDLFAWFAKANPSASPATLAKALREEWIGSVEPERHLRLWFRLNLVLAMNSRTREVADEAARLFVDEFARQPERNRHEYFEAEVQEHGEEALLGVLVRGDKRGNIASGAVFGALEHRAMAAKDASLNEGSLVRTVAVIEQLERWGWPGIERERWQAASAFLLRALHMVGSPAAVVARDRTLAILLESTPRTEDEAEAVMDVLCEADPARAGRVVNEWLNSPELKGREGIRRKLVQTVVANRDRLLAGTVAAEVLRELGTLVRRVGKTGEQYREAASLFIAAMQRELEQLEVLDRKRREERIQDMRFLVKTIRADIAAADVEELTKIDARLVEAQSHLKLTTPELEGKFVVVLGGKEGQRQSYRERVRSELGAKCETVNHDSDGEVKAACQKIKSGSVDVVVVVAGAVSHAAWERVKAAVESANRDAGVPVRYKDMPHGNTGAEAVVRAIREAYVL